jgi:hypothetical protein
MFDLQVISGAGSNLEKFMSYIFAATHANPNAIHKKKGGREV